jgi:hypothetical protein
MARLIACEDCGRMSSMEEAEVMAKDQSNIRRDDDDDDDREEEDNDKGSEFSSLLLIPRAIVAFLVVE